MTIKEILFSEEHIEPETIKQLFPNLTDQQYEKLAAVRTMYTTSHFWEDFRIFEKITRALNDLDVDFDSLQSCSPEDIWYAVDVADRIWKDREYSTEVQKYIQFVSNEDGVYIYPPQMDELIPNYLGDALGVLKLGGELADRTVGEVQAAKYLAIKDYIKTKREKELWS